MADQVKLLGAWPSPFSCRVELALKLKGVEYEYVEEDLSSKSQLLLDFNPVHKKIPVLLHNGKPVAESIVILEYIDETWKNNPILPQDPYERAMARSLANLIDGKESTRKIIKGRQEEREEGSKEFLEQIKFLESELIGKEFFGGQTMGFVDIVATLLPFWLMRGQEAVGVDPISKDDCPEIHKWIGKLREIDAVRECIPPKEKYLEYLRGRLERRRVAAEKIAKLLEMD